MLQEGDLDVPGKLLETITGLLSSPEQLAEMAIAARTQAHPDAAERIADRLAEMAVGAAGDPSKL
jgi:UDP-N-acetylglucosamine--N-acetylmuramyl-(pentapeptide) pyrophosphoryl-undecaprenol N-acetylglucosamine transferase